MKPSNIIKRSIVINHHKTSVSLEDQFWSSLKEIAAVQRQTISGLVGPLKLAETSNLSSAIRQFVLDYYRERSAP